ncbi:MAG TPA: GNAT family N-acetyltransferase [Candidatus Elarobacter sp.]|nr:GNAT family N-acetyltransferase [Candidatus Elarobacter sp.]
MLREPNDDDAAALQAYHQRNEARFAPWEPKRGTDVAQHFQWIQWRNAERDLRRARTFLACDRGDDGGVIGVVNLDAISRDERQASAMLSYSVDGAFEGKGYAREAVAATIAYAFDELELDSLTATYDPANARSGGLLARLGFRIVAETAAIPGMERLMRAQVLAMLARPA